MMNKEIKIIYVVGNKFLAFSEHEFVYTLDAFKKFSSEVLKNLLATTQYEVVLGQGLSEAALANLAKFFQSPESNNIFFCPSSALLKKKASKWMTHKHRSENILISEPDQVNELIYESELLCDDQCAEMQDHLTGEHLQATLLIEAVRQMLIATAESHWLKEGGRKNKYFVLDDFSSKFSHYIFPLEVTLRLNVESFRKGLNGNFKSVVNVDVIQLDQVMMQCHATFSAMDKAALTHLEKTLAQQCLVFSNRASSAVLKVA